VKDGVKLYQKDISEYRMKLLFIGPTILVLIVMNVFPLIWSLGLSFTNYSSLVSRKISFVGFANYAKILSDPLIWKYFQITARLVIVAVGVEFLLGFGLALLLKERFKGWGLVTTLMLIPMMLSPVVVGLFWTFIMDANFGLLNFLFSLFGSPPGPVAYGPQNRPLLHCSGGHLDVDTIRYAHFPYWASCHSSIPLRGCGYRHGFFLVQIPEDYPAPCVASSHSGGAFPGHRCLQDV